MLNWDELGGLGNLTKREQIRVLCETHLQVGISNDISVWILFVLARLISRKLHYRRGAISIMYYGQKGIYLAKPH